MNPTVSQAVIDEAYERDPAWAAAEYGAEFRSDIETFIAREIVDAATVPGRHELPPMARRRLRRLRRPVRRQRRQHDARDRAS